MEHLPRPPTYRLRSRLPSLRRYGLAVQHFPRFVNRAVNLHSVDVVLLSVIVRGRGRHHLGDEVYRERGASVAVTHYGQKHAIVTDAPGMDIYNVYLDLRNHPLPVLPAGLRPILSAILPLHPGLHHNLNRGVRIGIGPGRIARLAASLARIEEEMESPAPGAFDIVQHSFQVFLIDLCRAARENGFVPFNTGRSDFPAWVEALRLRLDQEFAAPHSLPRLAGDAGVSVAYLCRLFKAHTGKTVFRYLVERRIQAAIWKLREGGEKVISIALACGFNDLAYFNRAFKAVVGATPSAYRERMRAK